MGPQCRGTFGRSEVERFFFGRTNKRSHPSIGPLSSTGDCAVTTLVERLCRFAVWGDSIKRVRRTRARQLIDGASFGPEALKVIGQAFENAWAEIRGNFGDDPDDIDRARYRLANAVLAVAYEDSRDAQMLKRAALEAMALGYRDQR